MAAITSANHQITDSITQVNTQVLGDAPAVATGNLFMAGSQSLGLAALNATNSQQQTNMTSQASTTMSATTLYSINTGTVGISTVDILKQLFRR